ncbi:MAG: RNA-binding protein [Bacteroidota bacterium]|jgi:RNA recognition motif-containing protein|nr:RNA-binding protein [Bacteroidota bacterium]MDP4245246.1 RNA-binding protein [Bacteroidota bacterium]MDP4255850.1 RNA-binding protein [Bacteroidota bacterium]MDP4260298.1 RNA-binding protein [Bacteroidota bacterium]
MNMYVSNLGFQVNDQELKNLFSSYGEVSSAKVISDKETGRSRGFGFVEMEDAAAEKAMKELDGSQIEGRTLSVTKAKPRTDSRNGSFSRDRGSRW